MDDAPPPHDPMDASAGVPHGLPGLRLDEQICFPLYAASNLLTRLYRPLLQRLGLTYPQYLVMMVLWEHGGAWVSSLGERLHLDSGTLTPLLKRLEAAGLVLRERDAADERRVRVSLTPAGAALQGHARAVPQALACRMAGNVMPDPHAIATLRGQLQALVAQLQRALADGDASAGADSDDSRASQP